MKKFLIVLRDCVKAYFLSETKKSVQNGLHSASPSAVSAEIAPATSVHLTKWKFLAAKLQVNERKLIPGNKAQTELNKYLLKLGTALCAKIH